MKDHDATKLLEWLGDHDLTIHRSAGDTAKSETVIEMQADTLSLSGLLEILRGAGRLKIKGEPHRSIEPLVVDDDVSIEPRLVRPPDGSEPEAQIWLRFS